MKYFFILFFVVSLSSQLVQAKNDDYHGEIPHAPDDETNSYYDYASFTYKEYPQYSERDHSLNFPSTHTLPPIEPIKPEQNPVTRKDSNQNHNQDHKPKLDLNYNYDPADFQESSPQVASERNEETFSFSPEYYSPTMSQNFVNTVRHYHGDNLYRTYQQGRKVDAARAENIRERIMGSVVTGLDLINGEELETFARSMSILGSVTFGIGSKVGKSFKVLAKVMHGGDKAEDALKASDRMIESARKTLETGDKTIGFSKGTGVLPFANKSRSQHASRHLTEVGILPSGV